MDDQMRKLTLAQAPLLGRSNLDCFLEHTTPSVPCHYPLQRSSCQGDAWNDHCKRMPYINLSDLWTSFDEWSAYGVGVPLVLPCAETVVQYYVPYLSAIQIYAQAGCSFSPSKRRQGDDSEWSDVSDGRESSSDGGSDNERTKSDQWDSSSCVSFERLSCGSAFNEQGEQRRDDLLFEYFERGSPYSRAPLAGKINELAAGLPHLLTLNSNELRPASWFSVAWYPIYRIPMGRTMSDLSTCFLTFHSLWTPPFLQDELNDEGVRLFEQNVDISYLDLEQQTRKEQAQWLHDHSAWRFTPRSRSTLQIPAFGLASYKLSGPFWEFAGAGDKQHLASLASSADDWLRQLKVHHPDFDFFTSRA